MTRFLIIDDEPIAHRIIEGYANNLPHLLKVGNAYNAMEALTILQKESTDLIFLDINMPQLSGFEMLKTLSNPPRVIVTTAYQEFALEGYELNVTDYLLKPFSFERFLKGVNKVLLNDIKGGKSKPDDMPEKSIFLKEDRKLRKVWLNEIRYIEAYGNYCKVYLQEGMIITPERISTLASLLPEKSFLRIHKSYIVAHQHVEALTGTKIQLGDKFLPIGQTYANTVKRLLKND
ncbi:LytTR family DNA-binding domain-containing protein [Roseivirga sp. E12]|uniref:LytR/AlgR family response regulator transcription factor n=1 Tax=Roseivirga sp. E12 TaxID=2819237 RepID=UPI001ABD0187|nr:LytTR family DNA-binding domain-containing protein [Roseivirga sp. E12]MBO3697004.1 response regulator transcription factor [Roseivirga sp. E12]